VATLILANHAAVTTAPSCSHEPVQTALLDEDGMTLCHADATISSDDGIVDVTNVDEPDHLLDYYFGHGGRQVLLSVHGGIVEGWLETRWETTSRRWWLELD